MNIYATSVLPLSQRLQWIEEIFLRVRGPRQIKAALVSVSAPSWRRDFAAATLRATILEGVSSCLFELGVPECSDRWRESFRRFRTWWTARRFERRDLRAWLLRVVRRDDCKWIAGISPQIFAELIDLVQDGTPFTEQEIYWLRRSITEAILSLAMDLGSTLRHNRPGANSDLMFFALDFQIITRRLDASDERFQRAAQNLIGELNDCRARLEDRAEDYSSFRVAKASAGLARIELLLSLLTERNGEWLPRLIQELVLALVDGANEDRNFRKPLQAGTFRRLSRDIAESMGRVGEHYIVRNSQEYLAMIWRAGGAGFLTAGTIVGKFALGSLGLGLLAGGFMSSVNYSLSFLLMQVCGFRLATKQPSLTATVLISRIKAMRTHAALREAADEIASIARSLFAAAVGNFMFVIPATMLFHFGYRWMEGHAFLSVMTSHHVLESMSPWDTLTIPYAAFTGVLLWLSTVMASSVERWTSRLRSLKIGSYAAFGISSSIFLGLLLALVPVVGTLLGVPLDVRHFTLSTGSMTLAVCSLGLSQSLAHGFVSCLCGVLFIGILNFGVSFILSLFWSAVARGVRRAHLGQVFSMALANRMPSQFFFPIDPRLSGR